MQLPRIKPARCEGKFSDDLMTDPDWIAEEKLDGSRYQLYLEYDGSACLYSRRDFPRIEKAGNIPHIARPVVGLEGTILDGEVRHPNPKFLGDTTSVMLMTPQNAVTYQENNTKLHYTLFDILYWRGQDVTSYRYVDRREMLRRTHITMNNPYVNLVISTINGYIVDKQHFYDTIVARGGEGIVLKNRNSAYGESWVKKKKFQDASVIIMGYTEGKGKYAGTLGALVLGALSPDNKLIEVGQASGMTDDQRHDFWLRRDHFKYRVVDVRAQEMSRHNRLREPRFLRVRDDISPKSCTLEKLMSDMKGV